MADWLVRQPGSEPIGPVSTELVVRGLQAGRVVPSAMACRMGTQDWRLLREFPEFAGVVFDDAATNVTDSPWFADHPPARPPPPARPAALSRLGLAAPPTLGSRGIAPPPSTRPLVAGQRSYDEVDDDAETRIAAPPSEAAEFPVDDETMTRVAGAPQPPAPTRGGVLPTLPMPSREIPDFQATRADVPMPRPAAGAPAPPSGPSHDVLPPTQPFIQAGSFPPPPGAAFPPQQPGAAQAYGYSAPPAPFVQSGPPPPHGQYPPPQPYPPETGGDQGLKALVGLIVFLAVALAIVLILLVIRR